MRPPDVLARPPRDLEKHFKNFKATIFVSLSLPFDLLFLTVLLLLFSPLQRVTENIDYM